MITEPLIYYAVFFKIVTLVKYNC